MNNNFIPPPPELETEVLKRKKDIVKEGMDEFDKNWLSDRKKELNNLKLKHKIKNYHKKVLNNVLPFLNKKKYVEININHNTEVKNLLDKREKKFNILKKEIEKLKSIENLTEEEKILIKNNEDKIKVIGKQYDYQRSLLDKRNKEIEEERKINEKTAEVQRKKEAELLNKKDIEKQERILDLKNKFEIKKQDNLRKGQINDIIAHIKYSMKAIQGFLKLLNAERLPQKKIEEIKKRVYSDEEFNIEFNKMKDSLSEFKKLASSKKTFLDKEISELSDYFDSYKNTTKTVRSHIIERLNQLEQKNKEEENTKITESKKKLHAELVDERNKELEHIERKRQKKHQSEINKEKLKKSFGFKPKKFQPYFEIQDAIKGVKNSQVGNTLKEEVVTPNGNIQKEKSKIEPRIPYQKEDLFSHIEFGVPEKDWLKEFLKNIKGSIKKTQDRKSEKSNIKKEIDIPKEESNVRYPEIEFDIHQEDWFKDLLKDIKSGNSRKQDIKSKSELPDSMFNDININKKVKTPEIEFDTNEDDWLQDFLKNYPEILKARKGASIGNKILNAKKEKEPKKTIMPRIEFEITEKDWLNDILNSKATQETPQINNDNNNNDNPRLKNYKAQKKEIKKEILPIQKINIEKNPFTHNMEFDIEKDWLKAFNKKPIRAKKIISKGKKLDWEVDLGYEDWLKSFISSKIPKKIIQPKIKMEEQHGKIGFPMNDATQFDIPSREEDKSSFKFGFEKGWPNEIDINKQGRKIKKTDIDEVDKYKKYEDGINFIDQMIFIARDALMRLDLKKAKDIYIDILNVYNKLSQEEKGIVYQKVKDLYEERKNAERLF